MKRFIAVTATLFASAMINSVNAADMPLKAPVPRPVYDWTGFYLGINGGYSWGRSDTDYTRPGIAAFSSTQNLDGWLFGGQAGYNWQFNRNWIFGLEADIQGTGQRGTAALPGTSTTACPPPGVAVLPCTTTATTGSFEQKLPWFGTARLRLGYAPADRWMLYVTGGLAFGEVETNAAVATTTTVAFAGGPVVSVTPAAAAASASTTRAGWTVGGGTEWALWDRWSAKLEYLYVDLGTVNNSFTLIGAFPVINTSSHVTDNIFRVGLNYHFGGH